MRFERILVGVDLSPSSAAVLRQAKRLVADTGAIHVVHVVDASLLAVGRLNPNIVAILELRKKLAGTAHSLLEKLIRDEGLTASAKLTHEVAFGRPADVIVSTAANQHSNLVVVGAHSSGALDRILLGSVAEDVARRSAVPTLVVREPEAGPQQVDRILAAVDPSDPVPALEVLRIARDLEGRVGARLEVAHVIAPPAMVGTVYGAASPGLDVNLLNEVVPAAKDALDAFVKGSLARAGVKAHVLVGSPAREVVTHATPRDIIVCGTHAWGVLGRLAFGSVAAKIVRGAPCPVLVVGPHAQSAQEAS